MPPAKPLAGLRVVDLTNYLPGPLATLLLSDLGAEVIKVEPPSIGDPLRSMPPTIGSAGALFHCLNRGKRFVSLDLRDPDDSGRFSRLLEGADCLVEGFRPDVLVRLGFDPHDLIERHDRLVVARISGYGATGPYASRPGHDINYLALAGALDRSPSEFPLPVQVADVGSALLSLSALLAALLGQSRGLEVDRILDVPILDSALLFSMASQARRSGGEDPTIGRGVLEGALPVYRMYRDAGGRLVSVGALEPKFQAVLERIFGGVDEASITRGFEETTVSPSGNDPDAMPCVEPVLTLEEAREHPAVASRMQFADMSWPGGVMRLPVTPFAAGDPVPDGPWAGPIGYDNETVLS